MLTAEAAFSPGRHLSGPPEREQEIIVREAQVEVINKANERAETVGSRAL